MAQGVLCLYGINPENIIKKPPSAELKEGQKDSDTLPDYDLLDKILSWFIESNLSKEEVKDKGFLKEDVEKVFHLLNMSEYKRRQSPLGIKITPRAFGRDWRVPITKCFSL